MAFNLKLVLLVLSKLFVVKLCSSRNVSTEHMCSVFSRCLLTCNFLLLTNKIQLNPVLFSMFLLIHRLYITVLYIKAKEKPNASFLSIENTKRLTRVYYTFRNGQNANYIQHIHLNHRLTAKEQIVYCDSLVLISTV
jgi:hypothetical protein